MSATVRPARESDADAITAFTADTWPDRQTGDYIPDVIHDWIAADDPHQQTLVAESDTDVVGLLQVVLLSDNEAWCQGMRVHPEYRGQEIGTSLTNAAFRWAHNQGATVARNIVFSWNTGGLALSRTVGFQPVTEFRWVYPDLSTDQSVAASIEGDPDSAWAYWARSDTKPSLRGLCLDRDETWALSELTREDLAWAADETSLLVLQDNGTRGMTYRTRVVERDTTNGPESLAEYGVAAWPDLDAARSLFTAISRDAAQLNVDRVRVLIPETTQYVSDATAAGCEIADGPDFVFEADLTTTRHE